VLSGKEIAKYHMLDDDVQNFLHGKK